MADRFPLIVNAVSKKIEEIVSGDNLDLTGNGIVINGDSGISGQYLKSTGSGLIWDDPGNVYIDQVQTLSNKTFTDCTISGSSNILSNIPNSSLTNSKITVNGTTVSLGGSITVPDNNTTYTVSAVDGTNDNQKIIRLTSGGNYLAGVNDDIILQEGTNVSLTRTGDTITISSSYVDTNTVTTLQSATGGTPVSGAVTIAATGSATVSQSGNTITINSSYVDTITRVRAGVAGTFLSGDFTLIAGTAVTLSQVSKDITINSSDTVTRLKGGGSGSFVTGDLTLTGDGAATVSQSGNTITISATDTNTVTRVRGTAAGSYQSGDITITGSGATTVTQTGNSIEISSINTDTGASFTAGAGLILSSTEYSLKNSTNLIDNRIPKWDSSNQQFANSLIQDDGSKVTINGDLTVTGTNTIINTTTLNVADNIIELRRGNSLTGADGGIQVNRITDSGGAVTAFSSLSWYETGGYWRVYNGSISRRLVTESETQTLTNKTLTSPTLTNPSLGVATASTLNGLNITSTANATFSVSSGITFGVANTLTLSGVDNSSVYFRNGGNVAYTNDTLATFANTTSTQLRGVITDSTGIGKLTFATNPVFSTAVKTDSTSFSVFNETATTVNAFGAATTINVGAATGLTTIKHDLTVSGEVEFNSQSTDNFIVNGLVDFTNNDIIIRGSSSFPIKIGRGGSAEGSNTRVGYSALDLNNTGTENTAFGFATLDANTDGARNTGVGYQALSGNTIGFDNVAVGQNSMLLNNDGDKNIAIGNSALRSNQSGGYNVCIGHYAGYGALGSGNVIIGAAPDENSTNVTYSPLSASGNNQLIIGSGTEAWVRGDSSFNLIVPNDLTVGGTAIIQGDLVVNGTTTTINSNVMSIDDKSLELAAVVNTTFEASVQDASPNISAITPTAGLIPGMEVTITTGGLSVPTGTYIVSINGNQAVLSSSVSGSSGTATFVATGPSDAAANGGGIILKGTTNKTIIYDNSRTDKYWTFSENIEIAIGKKFVIGNQLALSSTTLGSSVVNSSLTSVGTLTGLNVDGATVLGGRVKEKVFNSYATQLTVSSNTLTINVAGSNTILGSPTAQAINTWAFTGVNLDNGQSITLSLILEGNTAATYGDACSVDGIPISNGVRWSGGSPPSATSNTDILTFVIVKDNSGVTRVYGQGNTDFS